MKGWPNHTVADVTDDYLQEHFGNGVDHNLGVVVRPPFIHVDLDSKPDAGASVQAWLSSQPQLAKVPRERTAGGAHLVFRCHDLPEAVARPKKAIMAQVNGKVTAELYTDGMNLVLSPSKHKSGAQYSWEVTGDIPKVSWAQLKSWFGFQEPQAAKRGRPRKEPSWITAYKGDVRTLKLKELFQSQAMLGRCLDPDSGKWSVRCPWSEEHSDGGTDWNPDATDTVILADTKPPGFKCLHAHCAERGLQQVCQWFEQRDPGCVDERCAEMRVWEQGQTNAAGRPRILLPADDRPDSVFADEVGRILAPHKTWFVKNDMVIAVKLTEFGSAKVPQLAFSPVEAVEARTAVELYVETGHQKPVKNSDELVYRSRTMTRECADGMLAAPQFKARLPIIERILPINLPIRAANGEIVLPTPGYDPRFGTYTKPDAPKILPMSLEEARRWLIELHEEFCIKDEQSTVHQIARLITPFCRGLMGWDARTPIWAFMANRPRCGKDFLAGVTQLIYEGSNCEDTPLGNNPEETRKRITAALVAGRRFMHLANCQGNIQDPVFIGAATTKTFRARALGSTDAKADLMLPNEMEFSLSANEGLTFRTDLEPRTRKIALAFSEENPNGRIFKKPRLHDWVIQHRSELLSAVNAFVQHWISKGCPTGPTPFNSFPEWAEVVGGVMYSGDLGDPCLRHLEDALEVGGDREERAMRALYSLCYAAHPEQWIKKTTVFELVENNSEDDALGWFGSFDEREVRGTKTKIGLSLRKFRGRELAGVTIEIDENNGRSERKEVRFTRRQATRGFKFADVFDAKTGDVGGVGDVSQPPYAEPKISSTDQEAAENYPAIGKEPLADVTKASNVPAGPPPQLLINPSALQEIAVAVRDAGIVALDIETYGPGRKDGLNPWRGDIRLLSLKIAGRDPWVIDLRATSYDLGPLAAALEAVMVIGHNLKFDALWLAVKCGIRLRKVFCTLTAARLLSAGTEPGNDLNKCLERYLGIKPDADHSTSDWGAMFLTPEQLAYAARDVAHLHPLRDVLSRELEQANLGEVAELEMGLLPVVVAMEQTGIAVNRRDLERIERESKQKQTAVAAQLGEALSVPGLNPNSTDQLQSALNKAGVKVPNTSAEALKGSGDTCYVPRILEYRAAKSQAQQAASLIKCIAPDDRIHGRFEPTGTDTGRFSSRNPSLQNIGRGPLRACFVAPAGSKLVVADYSQIELRAVAAIAGETKMIEAYRRGEDLHRGTAAAVLGKAPDKVTKEDRQLAKAVNFGLLYGQSAPSLVKYAASSFGVTLSEAEAKAIRSRFFGTYVKLRQWHERSWRTADNGVGEVRTALGRRRLIPAGASAWDRFTALVNTPVQGGCADGMKQALLQLAAKLPVSARIISTVHDEIIVEAPEHDATDVCRMVETVMIDAMTALYPQVPIESVAHVCGNWGEK
jgi:DNA polymerase-1